jgi:TPR repeat protein
MIVLDWEDVVKQLKENANQGDPKCIYFLGLCYLKGHIVEKDIEQGIQNLRKSAELNFNKAICFLAQIYMVGDLVPINF